MRKYLHLLDMRAEDFDQELLLQTLKGKTVRLDCIKTHLLTNSQPGQLINSKIMVQLEMLVAILCHHHAVVVH